MESQMSNICNLEDYRTPTPNTENSKVANIRKYKDVREREYQTSSEIESISKAAKNIGRHGHRDMTMVIMSYRHALQEQMSRLSGIFFYRNLMNAII